jgi:ribonuclease HI
VIYRQHHVKFIWIKGHADNPENERCDRLAVAAAAGKNLQADAYYESVKDKEDLFN